MLFGSKSFVLLAGNIALGFVDQVTVLTDSALRL
jgi:hypothetical protein